MPPLPRIPQISLLICDLDNTLYDWVTYFARAFGAMIESAVARLGVDREILLNELRDIHRAHHNSEHPFALMEARSIHGALAERGERVSLETLAPEFAAFNATRTNELKLYPGVEETLSEIQRTGTRIVAHTEASAHNATSRLRRLHVERFFSKVYAIQPAAAAHPNPRHSAPTIPYEITYLAESERKPNPLILSEIVRAEGRGVDEALYVGDSISRDMGMARAAGVWAAWARYGTRFETEYWQQLVRVTHWTPEDVARAETAHRQFGTTQPDFILDSFAELLAKVHFRSTTL
jgi:phosphoglycolate phosphatase